MRNMHLKSRFLIKVLSSYILLLLIFCNFVNADDRRNDKDKLVIMTLNAEFLWDGVEPEEGRIDFQWKNSQTEAEEHMRKVAELIVKSNPDIVNLVEVENIEALTTFNNKFLQGMGYKPYLIKGKDSYTAQDVALLTRIDPEGNKIERDNRSATKGTVKKTVSKNYYAEIIIENENFVIIGLHFLAQPNREDRRLQREAQAEVIRRLAVEKMNEGNKIIVLGDFNDYDGDINSKDHIDSSPITEVLEIVKNMDSDNLSDDLINVASLLPKANRYTAFYDANDNGKLDYPNEFTSIDHILISPKLVDMVEVVEIPHDHDPRLVTDHFPVIVYMSFDKGEVQTADIKIRMTSLLPNPEGDENENEELSLKNFGTQAVDLTNWKVRDRARKIWLLDELGIIEPGKGKTIKRNGKEMALNNNGDTVELIDPSGKIVQTITYHRAEEGEVVVTVIE